MQEDSRQDIGRFLGLDQKRNGAELTDTSRMENGMVSLRTWWSTSVKVDIPVFRGSSALERGALRSKKGKENCLYISVGRIHFHPKTISSTDTFIQNTFIQFWHFHPNAVSSNEHSSKNFFIQWHFHPMTFSSKNRFIQKIDMWDNQYSPCLCESVAGRRPATLHMKVCWRSKGGSLGV